MPNVSQPTLSVVTVTCNDPDGLRLTLGSLRPLFEAWPALAWEHIVVDGAPALSRLMLDALPSGWPLVHIEQRPAGVPHAFNEALTVATGCYVWFLNGGDGLRDPAALAKMIEALDRDRSRDFICGAAYLHRGGRPLYPVAPRRTLLGNVLGRSWMCHQAVIYRRAALAGIGPFSTAYRVAGDYEFHIRCYIAGLHGTFTTDPFVDYDMAGGSNDVATVFAEFKQAQRAHRDRLPAWVGWANEVVRTLEHARMLALRTVAATPLGARLRPSWAIFNRWLRGWKTRRS